MDLLSDVLRVARLSGGVFLRAEFSAPWCVASQMVPEACSPYLAPANHLIQYHFIVSGEPWVRVADQPATLVRLRPNEVVIFPQNDVHHIGSDLAIDPTPSIDVAEPDGEGMYRIVHGGGGDQVRMICGWLGCDFAEGNPVIAHLPRLLHLAVGEGGEGDWIRSTFQYAAHEIASGRPGSATVLAKLSELLFIEAVRRHVAGLSQEAAGWLAALRDPHVARALSAFHEDVGRNWTVEALARETGLSRSALGERFQRLLGTSPMAYQAQWRMQVAAQKLVGTRATLAQIADEVGYESEAAFSRAFKKARGVAPATWRRRQEHG
ncbi:AraC family transcriptional regulator [Novosphingobium sp. 9U]|uniref:AraC family transcriptional regulator n=1 Tax=Novosphingobium sp. 9U TaxID=2653158 RepID=UPI0012F15B9F|nr:AraC family transcriptional regulator [Novosphingobium sp. 9U]VWX54637.1 Transcriptional regulator, AraC family [Novosphingobium sp. 9U]